jgi:hypothetical protein
MHDVVAPRSRAELAIDLAIYTIVHETEDVPVEFFRCEEEIEIAMSFTGAEAVKAGALVCESLAELARDEDHPEVDSEVEEHAWEVARHLHEWEPATRRQPTPSRIPPHATTLRRGARARAPRVRQTVRRRTLARAGPDDGSGSPEPQLTLTGGTR